MDTLAVSSVNSETDSAFDVTGTYGSLAWDTDGSYSYFLDNTLSAVQALSVGESITDIYFYDVTDGHSSVSSLLTITITGTNDAPIATGDTGSIAEDTVTPVSGNLLANDTDVDQSDVVTVSTLAGNSDPTVDVAGAYGFVSWSADGGYSYTLDNANAAVQSLAAGDTIVDVFDYSITDNHAGLDASTLTVTISGTNDGPTAVADEKHDRRGRFSAGRRQPACQ